MFTPSALGTPGSPTAVRVALLGSGELGKEVAIALARLGVEVHAVDRYPSAPAHHVAYASHVCDMADPVALGRVLAAIQPDVVVPEIEALATDLLADLDAAGTIRVVPTARAVTLTMNREGIRRLAAEELGIATSPYRFASSPAELRDALAELGGRCVVKPIMSSSGHGQSIAEGPEDAEDAWQIAAEGGRVGAQRVICEGFVAFDYEITLLTVRSLSEGEVVTQTCAPIGHRQVGGDYVESWQPAPMSQAALERAQRVARRIVDALGGTGLFGVELFVRGDDVLFSEVSPRPHDTGLVTAVSQRLSEFDLHARAILGLPVDVSLRSPAASAVIKAPAGIAGPARYEGVADALADPHVDLRLFGKPSAPTGRRLGVCVATAETIEEARERARAGAAAVRVCPGDEPA